MGAAAISLGAKGTPLDVTPKEHRLCTRQRAVRKAKVQMVTPKSGLGGIKWARPLPLLVPDEHIVPDVIDARPMAQYSVIASRMVKSLNEEGIGTPSHEPAASYPTAVQDGGGGNRLAELKARVLRKIAASGAAKNPELRRCGRQA